MKTRLLTIALAFTFSCYTAFAKNTTTRVAQVTSQIELSGNVDYVITDATTPFSVTGGINITNTEHAVVILENIRPSAALSYLSFIKINGEDAVNDETCQVKMYAQGAIIMPYGKDIAPLTVYSEQNYGGESCNSFGLEHSGGYMNTLSAAKLNNRIRSFKLKRGYMVTFSNSARGRGYSRCFIADDEDLEFATLPAVLDQRITSYRIFKWNNAEKKGLASNTDRTATSTVRASWCYDWGTGVDQGPDCECVPNHIYEDWPTSAACGSVMTSPHMKTNNEPGNSADDHPQTVDEILANWENLMATGMRLCSPSSHDGSLSHLWAFMDSIDARGWRCDLLDIHSYWVEGSFGNLATWFNKYKRPIWISEWVWGASWNNNGAFASNNRNDDATYNGTLPILTKLNSWDYVERYAYWNSEQDFTKIYRDGQLTRLGNYYAEMKSGLGYKKANEFIPKVVCRVPNGLALTYDKSTRQVTLTWNNPNMELTDSTFLELRIGDGEWKVVQRYDRSELSTYTYKYTFDADFESGMYTYRVHNYDLDEKERYSGEVNMTLSGSEGTGDFQYGTMEIGNTDDQTGYFTTMSTTPYVFVSMPSYNNQSSALVNNLKRILTQNFTFRYFPWAYGSKTASMTTSEETNFMVISPDLKKIGDLTCELGDAGRINSSLTRITFTTPFPEEVTPVVFAYVSTTSTTYPYMVKISDITNEGFSVKLSRQAKEDEVQTTALVAQKVYYLAIAPGQTMLENGKQLNVGTSPDDKVDGSRARPVHFTDTKNEQLKLLNPIALFGSQTDNYDCASTCRINTILGSLNVTEEINGNSVELSRGAYIIRQKDDTNTTAPTDRYTTNGDVIGWMVVSDPTTTTGIHDVTEDIIGITVHENRIYVDGCDNYSVYTLNGTQMPHDMPLSKGVYIVKAGKKVSKVLIP